MKITKLGHCCLVIDIRGVRFLTDPGNYTTAQDEVKNIHYIVITHEHTDHLHVESLKKVLMNNPEAKILTNASVGKILEKESIPFIKISKGETYEANGVAIAGHGDKHHPIYKDYEQVENTGYFFDNILYTPGDAFHVPEVKVDILAFPVSAPWCSISDSVDYIRAVKPRIAFPIHDGNIIRTAGIFKRLPEMYCEKEGVRYIQLELGMETDL